MISQDRRIVRTDERTMTGVICISSFRSIFIFLILAIVLASCTIGRPIATEAPENTKTPFKPTDTPFTEQSKTATVTDTPELPNVSRSISRENIDRIVQLEQLGKGTITNPITFSPDGKIFAVPALTGVFLFDSQTFDQIAVLETKSPALILAFSPNGDLLAVGGATDRIQLWSLSDLTLYSEIQMQNHNYIYFHQIEFSRDGKLLAAAYGPNDIVEIFRVQDLALVLSLPGAIFSFSPDARYITSTAFDADNLNQRSIYLHELSSGTKLNAWRGRESTFSINERLMIQRAEDILVIEVAADTAMPPIAGTQAAFSTSGQKLAVFDRGALIVKHLLGKVEQIGMAGRYNLVEQLRFSVDDRYLMGLVSAEPVGCCVGAPDKLVVWNVVDGSVQLTLDLLEYSRNATFSPDGEQLMITDTDHIDVINLTDGKIIKTIDGFSNLIQGIAFSPDSQKLAAGYLGPRSVHFWRIEDGQIEKTLEDPDNSNLGTPSTISYSPDSRILFASGRFWEIASGNRIAELESSVPKNLPVISALSFNPKPFQLAAGFSDGSLRFWDLVDNQLIHELHPADGEVIDVTFSPDGGLVSVIHGYPAFSLQVWEYKQDYPRILNLRDKYYRQAVFSPDGRTIAVLAANRDNDYELTPPGSIQIWDLVKREMISEWKGENIMRIAYSPDGLLLAGGLYDQGAVQVWDPKNGELLTTLHGHVSRVIDVEFSADGSLLASASEDGTIALWGISSR